MDVGTNNKLKKRNKVKSYPSKKVDIEGYLLLLDELCTTELPEDKLDVKKT